MKTMFNNSQNKVSEIKLTGNQLKGCCLFLCILLMQSGLLFSQKLVYDDFEGTSSVKYTERTGMLDILAKNPKPDSINNSQHCASYVRNAGKKFDNIKMELPGNLFGVSEYATYYGIPAKIKMKVYTNAPIGTLVEILLGNKNGNNDYPAGTNSQYQVYTTTTNKWEVLEFKFSQVPQGSETSFNQINQITLLFNPNSSTSDTYYFDEITGPPILAEVPQLITSPKEEVKNTEEPKKQVPTKNVNKTN